MFDNKRISLYMKILSNVTLVLQCEKILLSAAIECNKTTILLFDNGYVPKNGVGYKI